MSAGDFFDHLCERDHAQVAVERFLADGIFQFGSVDGFKDVLGVPAGIGGVDVGAAGEAGVVKEKIAKGDLFFSFESEFRNELNDLAHGRSRVCGLHYDRHSIEKLGSCAPALKPCRRSRRNKNL